ncbi:MAG: ABC transporter ATP-binding protein, partial [Cyanobacteria bacterium REEB65]|nr:ABC transporter ATP-binding protein [Cyanobacteria bacterium REEB65]
CCLGFVFQFFNLVESLTVQENVRLARDLTGSSADVAELLESVGLAEKADRFPAELSSGQQQRAAIARALAKRAPLLLCDEPTGALDQESGKLVLSLLMAAADRRGCTVVVVTHNVAITRISDRVLHLRDGRIVEDRVNPARASLHELTW